MAHEIDTSIVSTGAAIYAGRAAWHGLGRVLPASFTSKQALEEAGLDFWVEKKQIFFNQYGGFDDLEPAYENAKDFYITVRTDTLTPLGTVGPDYRVLQNFQAFDGMDEILKDNGAVYESAASLKGGKTVFLCAKMPERWQISEALGDTLESYLLLATTHDGTGSLYITPVANRIECNNMLSAALGQNFSLVEGKVKRGRALKIRHTSSALERIKEARAFYENAKLMFEKTAQMAKVMLETPADPDITERAMEITVDRFVGFNIFIDAQGKMTINKKRAERRKEVYDLLSRNIEAEVDLVGNNMWGVFNGLTGYTDHGIKYRGSRKEERRFERLVGGDIDRFKGELVEVLCPRKDVEVNV